MRKTLLTLIGLLSFSTSAKAASYYNYVKVSTNTLITPPLQVGASYISSATIQNFIASTATISTMTITQTLSVSSNTILNGATFYQNGQVILGHGQQSVYISSNAVLNGATFYQNGQVVLGQPGQSVYISSNAVLNGATFYQNGQVSLGQAATSVQISTGINMNSNGITGLNAGANSTDAVNFSQLGKQTLQFVSSHTIVSFTYSGAAQSFSNTTVGVTITPTVTSSTMIITANGSIKDSNSSEGSVSICRNGSNISSSAFGFASSSNTLSATQLEVPVGFTVRDSPNSLSAQSYFICITRQTASDSTTWNGSGMDAYLNIWEIK